MGGVQIAAEFEAMPYLIAGDDMAVPNRTRHQAFLVAHIQPWAGQLCDALARHSKAKFYVAVAELTRAFMGEEAQGADMLA